MNSVTPSTVTSEFVAHLLETNEAKAYTSLVENTEPAVRERFGLDVSDFQGSAALSASGITESLLLNRVIGTGITEPATEQVLDNIDADFARRGVNTYAIELSPNATPQNLSERLRLRGFVPFKQTSMLYRPVTEIAEPTDGPRVRRAQPHEAAYFAELTCRIFNFGEPIQDLLRATFQSSSWQQWVAVDGDATIACAMNWIRGDRAWIGWVGTLPEHRGRGAQTALSVAQLRALVSAHVRWVTLETASGTKSRPSPSFRNYARLGWTHAYNRMVYVKSSKRPTQPAQDTKRQTL